MLSKKEVEQVAKLARLGLSNQEMEKYRKELSSILDYFGKLKEIDGSEIEPTSHPQRIQNVVRKDESQEKKEKSEKLLKLAPETKDKYIKVKSVLK